MDMFDTHVLSRVDAAVKAARRAQNAMAAHERGQGRDVDTPLAPVLVLLAQLAAVPGAERWVPSRQVDGYGYVVLFGILITKTDKIHLIPGLTPYRCVARFVAALAKRSQLPKGLGSSLQYVVESKVPQAAEKVRDLT